ncbi:hypothetical protein FYJ24_07005 [Actinomycetaceae bacterium WB03_NA08]|uniref:Uncharacterized protein n=1 Tax=Scrofimicrobium canadense TaxID=2652290 RepID=A0A6N7W8C3_9ACTO|nr:hypothetical protein [Scrofimicrobium canadense]MSS84516.1 hypothetical protein [Scrofimicrobium canadense]
MADKRAWAKIDTGYMLNPKWFHVERHLRSVLRSVEPIVIRNAIRTAREAHLASILYAAQNLTDGLFPVDTVKALAVVQTDEEEAAITALFEVGLWINHAGGMAEVHDYLEHQQSAEKAKQLSAAGRAAAEAKKANRSTNRSTNRVTDRKIDRKKELLKAQEAQFASEFDAWWDHWPVKRGKTEARDAFINARSRADLETLTAGADRYAAWLKANPDRSPKYAQGWLNKDRWTDDLGLTPTTSDPRQQRIEARKQSGDIPIPPELFKVDDPLAWRAWQDAFLAAIGDGADDQQAIDTANQQTGR